MVRGLSKVTCEGMNLFHFFGFWFRW